MEELPKCEVCGSTSYNKVSGFYICVNCDTQSQEIQEQFFEYSENQRVANDEEREEIVTVNLDSAGKELTSWENYNLILKGLVNELCELGAPPKLKIVVFQLWACYLQKANAAFFSKYDEKLPILPLGFKSKDAEILFGINNLRKNLFKDVYNSKKRVREQRDDDENEDENEDESANDSSSSLSNTSSSSRSLRFKQHKLALSQLNESSSARDRVSFNESLQNLTPKSSRKKRLKLNFKAVTKSLMADVLKEAKQLKKTEDSKTIKRVKRKIKQKFFDSKRSSKVEGNMVVTLITLVSLLRFGLILLGNDILLGDILRWIREGKLSISQAEKFLPNSSPKIEFRMASRNGFQIDSKNVSSLLGLKHLPTPNLYKLVGRYCIDLCLPGDFISYVHGIMNLLPPEMKYENYNFRVFPDYEGRALAYIIFALKLLFSLDGLTEKYQSKFADDINKFKDDGCEIPILFSWNSWIQYIECRKAILSKYCPVVNYHAYKGRIDNDLVFLKYWHRTKLWYTPKTESINRIFLSANENIFKRLQTPVNKTEDIEFPTSLTPHVDKIRYLIENHRHLISEEMLHLLKKDFSAQTIKYILNQEWCKEMASKCNLPVQFVDDLPDMNIENFKEPEETVPVISRSSAIPAYVPVGVIVVDEHEEEEKSEYLPKCQSFTLNAERIKTTSSQNVEKNQLYKIFNPAQNYWFLHSFDRAMSNAVFNGFAEKNFSSSFFWLLKECAYMIDIELKDLYLELITVESVLHCSLGENDYSKNCPIQLYPGEW